MALSKITYATKVALNPQPSIADENKVTDANMNEIKSVVNDAIDQIDLNTTKASGTYANFLTAEKTISGSPEDLATVTLTTTGKPLLVSFTVPAKGSGNGSPQFLIYVDNTQKINYVYSYSANHIVSFTTILTDVTAGSHTIKLKGSKGNDTALVISSFITINLAVAEL